MITFSEKQKFRQWWLWILLAGVLIVPIVLTLRSKPATGSMITDMLIGAAVPALIIVLFAIMELRTSVNADGIYYRFFPLHFHVHIIKWDEVKKAYTRPYSPIGEYGGWGIRMGLGGKGKAYNVSGNIGLQIELNTGKKILIGTQRPDEINTLLQQLVKARVLKQDMIKP